jgi:hypothetical protein
MALAEPDHRINVLYRPSNDLFAEYDPAKARHNWQVFIQTSMSLASRMVDVDSQVLFEARWKGWKDLL